MIVHHDSAGTTAAELRAGIPNAECILLRQRAEAFGQQIRNEDGTGKAIKWIGKYSSEFQGRY